MKAYKRAKFILIQNFISFLIMYPKFCNSTIDLSIVVKIQMLDIEPFSDPCYNNVKFNKSL